MSRTADTGAESLDDRPEWARGYEEPVVVAIGRGDVAVHDPDLSADEPVPDCSQAARLESAGGAVKWRVRERSTCSGRRCRQCSGDIDRPDGEATTECGLCGEEVHRTQWPQHVGKGCDGV